MLFCLIKTTISSYFRFQRIQENHPTKPFDGPSWTVKLLLYVSLFLWYYINRYRISTWENHLPSLMLFCIISYQRRKTVLYDIIWILDEMITNSFQNMCVASLRKIIRITHHCMSSCFSLLLIEPASFWLTYL